MRHYTHAAILLIVLVVCSALLGALAPVQAQREPQFDGSPVAYVYLPLVESDYAPIGGVPPTGTLTVTPTPTATLPRATLTPTSTTTSTLTPTPTSTAYPAPSTPTRTPSPTSQPGPPTLLAPANGAVLAQPVNPNEWLFHWSARTGPCYSSFSASGPNGYSISAYVHYQTSAPGPYAYHYTRTVPFPAAAFGLWTWRVMVICPAGSAQSETRPFYLQGDPPTPTPTANVRRATLTPTPP